MSYATFIPWWFLWRTRVLHFRAIIVIMLLMVSVSVCWIFVGWGAHPTFAIQSKPPTDWSFYISSNNGSQANTLGCNQGKFDASKIVNSEVVLDFGGQNSSGTGSY